jgi:hypothetical protein
MTAAPTPTNEPRPVLTALPDDDEAYIRDRDLAAILDVSHRQVGYLRQTGRLAFLRISERKYLFRVADVKEYLRSCRVPAVRERKGASDAA